VNESAANEEIAQLQAQVAALEELLEVYEQETLEKSARLEKALQQLIHSEAALRVLESILESMGDGVVVVDEQGQLLFNNAAAAEMGYTTGSDLSPSRDQQWFLPGEDSVLLTASHCPIARAMTGEAIDNMELYTLDSCQQKRWLSVTARPLKDKQGDLQGAVAVFHDITHSKQIEAALRRSEAQSRQQAERLRQAFLEIRQTQAQLIQTEKMSSLGQLVAGIAHEINNPVNFIYGNIHPAQNYISDVLMILRLYQQYYPEPVAEIQSEVEAIDLEFIQQDLPKLFQSLEMGADRIRQIVSSLRNFSRLDEAEMKPVNIHEGIDNTLLILQNQLKSKLHLGEIQIIKQYGELPLIECYAGQLNQVFMNILSNAIDALYEFRAANRPQVTGQNHQHFDKNLVVPNPTVTESATEAQSRSFQPTIWIQTKLVDSDHVSILIRNNGPWIDEKTINRLFDPFFTTKPVGQGTGLGLYISYQIVTDKHKGTLKCVSAPGQGVEFLITIPIFQR